MAKKNQQNRRNSVYVPTLEEFHEYCTRRMKLDDKEWIDGIWLLASKVGWRKKNGEAPNHWHSLVSAYHGVLLTKWHRKPHLLEEKAEAKSKPNRKKKANNNEVEEFPDNGLRYIAYTDGSCDNCSQMKAGGAAYILIKDGEVVKVKNHGQLSTTNNRMELLAIISAINSCPENAYVDVYTDSRYSILTLGKDRKPNINGDLWELYQRCSRHVAGIHLHWVKGHAGDHYNEMADELAYGAYCDICDKFGIKRTSRH